MNAPNTHVHTHTHTVAHIPYIHTGAYSSTMRTHTHTLTQALLFLLTIVYATRRFLNAQLAIRTMWGSKTHAHIRQRRERTQIQSHKHFFSPPYYCVFNTQISQRSARHKDYVGFKNSLTLAHNQEDLTRQLKEAREEIQKLRGQLENRVCMYLFKGARIYVRIILVRMFKYLRSFGLWVSGAPRVCFSPSLSRSLFFFFFDWMDRNLYCTFSLDRENRDMPGATRGRQ